MNPANSLMSSWRELKAQWLASDRLRVGGWLVLGILAVYGLQLGLGWVDLERDRLHTLDAELGQLKALSREDRWAGREADASHVEAALASMTWAESNIGLTEAAFQDWLRTVPAKLGLKTRELSIARLDEKPRAAIAGQDGVTGIAELRPPHGYVVLRARLSFNLDRAPLMSFLAECARNERSIVVEHLALRSLSQPPVAEIDLRVLARNPEVQP